MVCVRAACSTARNGPTSLPVGETTPIAPARISSGSQVVNAKTAPASDHQERRRRRGRADDPSRSALVVSHSEMIVSPISVSVRTTPIGERIEPGRGEVEDQDDRQEPVPEHAQRPHREQQPAVPVEPAQAGHEPGVDGTGWSRPRFYGRGCVCQNGRGGSMADER